MFLSAQHGALDYDFDADGIVTTDYGNNDVGQGVAIQPDGKIVVAGWSDSGTTDSFIVVRYNPDGSLDNSFGSSGKATVGFSSGDARAFAVQIQLDGAIVVAGYENPSVQRNFAVARLLPNGNLDYTFSFDGKTTTAIGSDNDEAYDLVLQTDGKIIVAGNAEFGGITRLALVRYNPDGSLDHSFGTNGIATTDLGGDAVINSIALQTDGKIVAGGHVRSGSYYDFAVARYKTNGTLDSSFSFNGWVSTTLSSLSDYCYGIAIQSDGKILAVGSSYDASIVIALVRYNTDGSLDNSFGTNGVVKTDINVGLIDAAHSLTLQSDGKIVAGGTSSIALNEDFALTRYKTNGTLDSTFGINGKVTTPVGTDDDIGQDIVLQQNGRIVLVGRANSGLNEDIAIARYLSGLNVGVLSLNDLGNEVLIFPNPVHGQTELKYELKNDEWIDIVLHDVEGRVVKTFVAKEKRAHGFHREVFNFDETIMSGNYILSIKSESGSLNIKIVKQ